MRVEHVAVGREVPPAAFRSKNSWVRSSRSSVTISGGPWHIGSYLPESHACIPHNRATARRDRDMCRGRRFAGQRPTGVTARSAVRPAQWARADRTHRRARCRGDVRRRLDPPRRGRPPGAVRRGAVAVAHPADAARAGHPGGARAQPGRLRLPSRRPPAHPAVPGPDRDRREPRGDRPADDAGLRQPAEPHRLARGARGLRRARAPRRCRRGRRPGRTSARADVGVVVRCCCCSSSASSPTRFGGGLGAALVGLVAGLGFALVSISSRLVPEITVSSVLTPRAPTRWPSAAASPSSCTRSPCSAVR